MAFSVLTIGREFGCGSGEIAGALAQRLGWKLFDRELIDEIARVAHLEPGACRRADERLDSWLHRLGRGLWNAAGEKGPALVPDQGPGQPLDADAMAALSRRVIEDVAAVGRCVIVGRGGNYVLRARHDAFHLFLYAPQGWRARRLESQGIEPAAASALVEHMDHDRAAYIRRYFDEEWARRQFYHLMVNASLGATHAVASTCAALDVAPT